MSVAAVKLITVFNTAATTAMVYSWQHSLVRCEWSGSWPSYYAIRKQLLAPVKLETKDLVWTFWTRETSLALQGIKPPFLSHPAYSLVSILTPTVSVLPITYCEYHISQTIRRTLIFSLVILEKNNDESILILVIYWKKTGLVHTKISNHNIIYSYRNPENCRHCQ